MSILNQLITGTKGGTGKEGPVASGVFVSVAMAAWKQLYGRRLLDDICCDSFVDTSSIDLGSKLHCDNGGFCDRQTASSGVIFSSPIFSDETYYRESKNLISFSSVASPYYNSNYVNQISRVSCSGTPPTSVGSMLSFSPRHNSLYLYGGVLNGQISSDLWQYSFNNSTWMKLTPSGSIPSARLEHMMVCHPASGTLIMFGGLTSSGYVNDLWSYSIDNNRWTQMSGGVPPGTRAEHIMAFDPYNNMIHIMQGRNAATFYSEYFQYRFFDNTWVGSLPGRVAGQGARSGGRMVYDPQTNSLFIHGGTSNSSTNGELWQYCLNEGWWVQRYSNTQMPPFSSQCTVFDPISRTMLSVGGQSSMFGGTFLYNWSTTLNVDTGVVKSSPIGANLLDATNGCCTWNSNDNSAYIFGGQDITGANESSKLYRWIYNSYTLATGINLIYSSTSIPTNGWTHLDGISIKQSVPLQGQSAVYYAVSFDQKQTWKIWRADSNWYSIVQLNGSQYQYRNSSGAWVNSSPNTLSSALKNAFLVTKNQWVRSREHLAVEQGQSAVPALWNYGLSNGGVPNYTITSSYEYNTHTQAWRPFGDLGADWDDYYWLCPVSAAGNWMQVDLGPRPIIPVAFRYRNSYYNSGARGPKRWKLTGSNDQMTWTDLFTTYSGVDSPTVATNAYSSWFTLSGVNSYRYLRMTCYSSQADGSWVGVRAVQFKSSPDPNGLVRSQWETSGGFVPGTTSGIDLAVGINSIDSVPSFNGFTANYMTSESDGILLISKSWQSASTNPTLAQCLIKCKFQDSIVLNTDFKVWVSTDGGNNYDQITNLSVLPISDGYTYIAGYNNGLVARNGSTMKLKIQSFNYKNLQIYGTCLAVDY